MPMTTFSRKEKARHLEFEYSRQRAMPNSEIPVRLTSLKNSSDGGISRGSQSNQTPDNSAACGGR